MRDTGNPWDDRLSQHPDMGQRIVRVMDRMERLEKVAIDIGDRNEGDVLGLVS